MRTRLLPAFVSTRPAGLSTLRSGPLTLRFLALSFFSVVLLAFGVLGFGARDAEAQTPFRSASLTGMGGGGPAVATQVDGLFLNPANLAVAGERAAGTELVFWPLAVRGGGSLLQTGFYDEYLTGGEVLSDEEVDTIVEEWFGSGMRTVGASTDAVVAGFARTGAESGYGGAMRLRASMGAGFNRGVPELLLKGTGEERSFPLDGRVRSYSAIEFSGGYGWRIDDRLAVGVSPKLVAGVAYAEMDFTSTVTVSDSVFTHRFDYEIATAGLGTRASVEVSPFADGFTSTSSGLGGWGLGADVGATYQWTPSLRVAASLTDVGAIHWSGDARRITPRDSVFRFDGMRIDRRRIRNEFDGDVGAYFEHVLDSMATDTYEDTEERSSAFVSALPTALHVGARWELDAPGSFLAGGVSMGVAETGGHVRTPSLYVGGQYLVGSERRYMPIRAGLRVGGARALGLALGTGFRLGGYELGVGAMVTPDSGFAGGGYEVALATALMTFHL